MIQVCPTLRAGGNRTGGDRPPGTDVDTADSLIPVAYGGGNQSGPIDVATARNACASASASGRMDFETETFLVVPIATAIRTANTSANGHGISDELAHTLDANYGSRRHNGVMQGMRVRRLTPTEAERLQGFPDDYTAIPWRKKPASECPDGPRYKALGNSWAVPNVRWIGERIAAAVKQRCA